MILLLPILPLPLIILHSWQEFNFSLVEIRMEYLVYHFMFTMNRRIP